MKRWTLSNGEQITDESIGGDQRVYHVWDGGRKEICYHLTRQTIDDYVRSVCLANKLTIVKEEEV